jgi:hypothetical protein
MTTTEPDAPPVEPDAALAEILVQRLPGASCWDLYRAGGRKSASPNLDLMAREALHEVRRLGGRAIVRYDDQDSMTARAERKRLGQTTVNAVFDGARYWARWSPLHAAYEPCDRDAPDGLIMRVDSIDFKIHEDDHQGYYTHLNTAAVAFTRPLLPHEIVHLVTVDGEVPE